MPPALRRDRHRQHAVAVQQRYRLEMRVGAAVSVDAGTRVHDVEMRTAAAGTAARRRLRPIPSGGAARRRRAIHRSTAAVAVGEQLVIDPAGQHRHARHREPADFSRRELGEIGHRMPHVSVACCVRTRLIRTSAGITVALPRASAATTSIDEISGAAARTASSTVSSSVTDDDGQLLQLPCELQADDIVVDLEQMDVAAVRAEVGPHAVERVLDPPLDVVRV